MRSAAQLIIPVLFPRAIVLWALIRLTFAILPLAGGEAVGAMPVPTTGVIALTCIVGLVEVRMRRERILWANLGVSALGVCAVYGVAAISAECVLALVVR